MDEARWERIDRTIEFLTNQQAASDAKFSAWIDKADRIIESLQQSTQTHETLIETLFALQDSTQRKIDKLAEKVGTLTDSLTGLAEAQRHTDERLNALIGFVDRNNR